jgi:AcrR family transcriptional regulator
VSALTLNTDTCIFASHYAKPFNREKILVKGFHVVLGHGYCGATVCDIVRAGGVPPGSFTNHFRSKEALCPEILECYFTLVRENFEKTLRGDESRRPRSHRHCCDKAQLLLRRPAGCLNR